MNLSNESIVESKILRENKIEISYENAIVCLNANNLESAINHIYEMILEITDDSMLIDEYDALYCIIYDKLVILRQVINKIQTKDKDLSHLYELAQMKFKALPRCYLMIIIAYSIINYKLEYIEKITKDLNAYCSSVQSSVKGVYLRRFLIENILSIKNIQNYENLKILTEFLLFNFRAINKLWIKIMKFPEINNRIAIFKKLKVIIYFSIKKLAELAELDPEIESTIVNFYLNEIPLCGYSESQVVLIAAFQSLFLPDYSIKYMTLFFQNIRNITSEYDRTHFFDKYCQTAALFLTHKNELEIKSTVNMILQHSDLLKIDYRDIIFLNFCIYESIFRLLTFCKISDSSYVSRIFGNFYALINSDPKYLNLDIFGPLTALLNSKIKVLEILGFESFFPYVKILKHNMMLDIFILLCEKFETENSTESDYDNFHLLFYLYVYINNFSCAVSPAGKDYKNLESKFIKVLSLFKPKNIIYLSELIKVYVENCFESEISPEVFCSVINIIFINIKYIYDLSKIQDIDNDYESIFTSCFEIISKFKEFSAEIFPLYILGATTIDSMDQDKYNKFTVSYIRESFVLLEDKIKSQNQLKCLNLLVDCLIKVSGIGLDAFKDFCEKLEKNAKSFTSSTHQFEGLLKITNLYWIEKNEFSHNSLVVNHPESVLRCLNNCLCVINSCIGYSHKLNLYLQILDKSLYFYENKCPSISMAYIDSFMEEIEKIWNIQKFDDKYSKISEKYELSMKLYQSINSKK